MKNMKLPVQFVIALCLVAVGMGLSTLLQSKQDNYAAPQPDSGIALQLPPLFQTAHAQDAACDVNLLADAGVTAYTNLAEEIDITFLESYFSGPVQQTDQAISGIVLVGSQQKPPQLDEAAVVHAVVCADGWLFAYLSREQPASALIDWTLYEDEGLSTTPLEVVVRLLAEEMGFTLRTSDIGYFDFRYPEATNLKLIADSVDTAKPQETFQITIPKRLTVYEYSWTHSTLDDSHSGTRPSGCTRNGTNFSTITPNQEQSWRFAVGTFDDLEAISGTTQNFVVGIEYYATGYCGVALVY